MVPVWVAVNVAVRVFDGVKVAVCAKSEEAHPRQASPLMNLNMKDFIIRPNDWICENHRRFRIFLFRLGIVDLTLQVF
jgi:hypothetical protein